MPHSKFKERVLPFSKGVAKCSCCQTFVYKSYKDLNMKLQLYCKFCSKLPEGSKDVVPKKAMMLKEVQCDEAERMKRVHECQWKHLSN